MLRETSNAKEVRVGGRGGWLVGAATADIRRTLGRWMVLETIDRPSKQVKRKVESWER